MSCFICASGIQPLVTWTELGRNDSNSEKFDGAIAIGSIQIISTTLYVADALYSYKNSRIPEGMEEF